MENPIGQELSEILSDLTRISDLVAQKETELGFVHHAALSQVDNDCFALELDEQTFYLDRDQLLALLDQIVAIKGDS